MTGFESSIHAFVSGRNFWRMFPAPPLHVACYLEQLMHGAHRLDKDGLRMGERVYSSRLRRGSSSPGGDLKLAQGQPPDKDKMWIVEP